MSLEKQSAKQAGQAFPKPGTANYETAKSDAVNALVQAYERQAKAATLGINVTDKQVQTELDKIIKQNFANSPAKYKASLKTEGITDAFVRFYYVKTPLIGEKLYANITKGVTVSPSDIAAYYAAHLTTYQKPESRNLRHILVKSKTLAQSIYKQLAAGNDQTWCTLAKKYSQDPVVEGQVREADGHQGRDGAGVRQGRVLAADQQGARAGLRLGAVQGVLHHRAAVGDQAGNDDAREQGRRVDQEDAPDDGEDQRRVGLVDRADEGLLHRAARSCIRSASSRALIPASRRPPRTPPPLNGGGGLGS